MRLLVFASLDNTGHSPIVILYIVSMGVPVHVERLYKDALARRARSAHSA